MNKVVRHFLNTHGRLPTFWFAVSGKAIQVIILNIVGSILLSRMVYYISSNDSETAIKILIIYLPLMLLANTIDFATNSLAYIKENELYAELGKTMYSKMMNKDMSYFRDRHTGYLTKYYRDYSDGLLLLTRFFRQEAIGDLIVLLFPPIILTYYDWRVGVISWIMLLIQICYIRWASSVANIFRVRSHDIYRKINGLVSDDITNVVTFKSAPKSVLNSLFKDFDKETGLFTSRHLTTIKLDFPRSMVTTIAIGISYFIVIKSSMGTAETVALVVLIINFMAMMNRNINNLPNLVDRYDDIITRIEPVLELLNNEDEKIKDPIVPKSLDLKTLSVSVKDITFKYQDSKEVIKSLSFDVTSGKKIGIVGLSGAGKSTLASLLMRFDDVSKGSIMFNNVDIRDIKIETLRSAIAYVPQEPLLFHQSIKDNIIYYAPDAPISEVHRAAKAAHIHDFIMTLPNGYETLVGERGVKLSGGQKQRVVIARAIMKKAPLLLFDEATSALDSESEHIINSALPEIIGDHSAIIIAHRLSSLVNMDEIIVMENGNIFEQGTHKALLKLNGRYAKLWEKQTII